MVMEEEQESVMRSVVVVVRSAMAEKETETEPEPEQWRVVESQLER